MNIIVENYKKLCQEMVEAKGEEVVRIILQKDIYPAFDEIIVLTKSKRIYKALVGDLIGMSDFTEVVTDQGAPR